MNRYGVLKIVTVTFLSRTNLACQHFFKDNQNVRNQLKSVFYKNIIFAWTNRLINLHGLPIEKIGQSQASKFSIGYRFLKFRS